MSLFALSQASSPPSGIPTIHVTTDLIQVPVLVLRPPFRIAAGLSRNNFSVSLDGGPSFQPSYVRPEGAEPIGLSVLVFAEPDEPEQLAGGLQAAIQAWPADLLHNTDKLSIYVSGCHLLRSLDHAPADLNRWRDAFVQAVSFSTFNAALAGGKNCKRPMVDEVLEAAISQIATGSKWKVLLIIVNGERPADINSLRRVQPIAAAQGVTLFAIKYLQRGSSSSSVFSPTEGLNVLVSSLGGISVYSTFKDMGDITESIIRDIRERYILSFPRPANGSAGAHRIEIKTNVKGLIVRSSAVSAPVLDGPPCMGNAISSLCDHQRPQYGIDKPQD
jgi:hypothetical protein